MKDVIEFVRKPRHPKLLSKRVLQTPMLPIVSMVVPFEDYLIIIRGFRFGGLGFRVS